MGFGELKIDPKMVGERSFFFALDAFLSSLSSTMGCVGKENDERRALRVVVWLRIKGRAAGAARVSRIEALLETAERMGRFLIAASELERRSIRGGIEPSSL